MAVAHADAARIHSAIKGLGTDDAALVDVIAHRSNNELQEIASEYSKTYQKSMIEDIKNDSSGDYRDLLVGLVEARPVFIARAIHEAVKGLGTDEAAIIDCLAHASNALIQQVREEYTRIYSKDIVAEVGSDTSGDLKALLELLLRGGRDETGPNLDRTKQDAKYLWDKGEGRLGTNSTAFIEVLSTRSFVDIREINRFFMEEHKHDLATSIDKEFSGYVRRALIAIVTPREEYWAWRIHDAVRGLGTKDKTLIRAFVLNGKQELKAIAEVYNAHANKGNQDKKGKPIVGVLEKDIQGDTSGWYEKTLLALLH